MGGRSEVANDLLVARSTFFRADELRAGNAGRSENCTVCSAAGKQNKRQRYSSSNAPQQAFAPNVNPSTYSGTPHESRVCAEIKNDGNAFFQVFCDPVQNSTDAGVDSPFSGDIASAICLKVF